MLNTIFLLVNGFENQGQDIVIDFGFKLVTDLLQENRNVLLELIVSILVEGKLAVGTIDHFGINADAAVMIIEEKTVQSLPVILPHNPFIMDHLLDELRELGPEGNGLADGKVAMTAVTAGIDYDTPVDVTKTTGESTLKIDGKIPGLALHHFHKRIQL